MNKKQELVGKFLKRDLEGTKLFAAFNDDCKESIKAADARRKGEEDHLQELYKKYGRDTVASSERTSPGDDYVRAKNHAEKHCQELKMAYTQACSIAIESGALCCQVPVEMTIPGRSVYIELSGMRLFFQGKRIELPKHLIGKDPLECEAFADWIIETMISEGNLFAWYALRKELNN